MSVLLPKDYHIACDGAELCDFRRIESNMSPTVARMHMQSQGWAYVVDDRRSIDLCPKHAKSWREENGSDQ